MVWMFYWHTLEMDILTKHQFLSIKLGLIPGIEKFSYGVFSDLKTLLSLRYTDNEKVNDSLIKKLLDALCILQRFLSDFYKLPMFL